MPPSRRARATTKITAITLRGVPFVAVVAVALTAATVGPVVPGSQRAVASPPRAAAAPGPSPRTSTGQGTLSRVAGADRIATSILTSQTGFPTNLSASTVVLARADEFADALAGTPLAAHFQGPLLLTLTGGLTAALQSEIQRVLPVGRTVYLLGGVQAIAHGRGNNSANARLQSGAAVRGRPVRHGGQDCQYPW